LDPGKFSAVLRAVEDVTGGRTMTMPRMLVNNNETATLGSVLESPYTSTNASTTVATTSFGGSSEAGTTIQIKPQVAAGDSLVIDYDISLSGFVGEAADPALPPPKQSTSLKSVVTVPDGFAVIVGGIEQDIETKGESRVPFLGEIPLLGALFSSSKTNRSKSRFFVFLRCNVMRSHSFEELRYVSSEALYEAGLDDGWPRLRPRVIR
jgi:type II secretory pathway component GspD/PulD (secretin)